MYGRFLKQESKEQCKKDEYRMSEEQGGKCTSKELTEENTQPELVTGEFV